MKFDFKYEKKKEYYSWHNDKATNLAVAAEAETRNTMCVATL